MKFLNFYALFRNKKKITKLVIGSTALIASCSAIAACTAISPQGNVEMEVPEIPFNHTRKLGVYDYASVRRGFQVFKEVCSACHSMRTFSFRHLVGATHTEEEAKALAAEYEFPDVPDDQGNIKMRPGRLVDYWQDPYPNMEAAKAANNGTYPADFSMVINSHEGLEHHFFMLLNGYNEEPPPGINITEGTYYNIYAKGQVISMPPPLYNGQIEYFDGTPATKTQMSYDVLTFLRWVFDPHLEERKRTCLKGLFIIAMFLPFNYLIVRMTMNAFKHRKIVPFKMNWK